MKLSLTSQLSAVPLKPALAIAIESQGVVLRVLVGAVEGLGRVLPACGVADKVESIAVAVTPCPPAQLDVMRVARKLLMRFQKGFDIFREGK